MIHSEAKIPIYEPERSDNLCASKIKYIGIHIPNGEKNKEEGKSNMSKSSSQLNDTNSPRS